MNTNVVRHWGHILACREIWLIWWYVKKNKDQISFWICDLTLFANRVDIWNMWISPLEHAHWRAISNELPVHNDKKNRAWCKWLWSWSTMFSHPSSHLISSHLLHPNWWTGVKSCVWYNIGLKPLWNNLASPFEALLECNKIVGMNGYDKCWGDKRIYIYRQTIDIDFESWFRCFIFRRKPHD